MRVRYSGRMLSMNNFSVKAQSVDDTSERGITGCQDAADPKHESIRAPHSDEMALGLCGEARTLKYYCGSPHRSRTYVARIDRQYGSVICRQSFRTICETF